MPLSQMLTLNALLSRTYIQIGEAWKSADELVFATCQEVYGGIGERFASLPAGADFL